MRLEATFEFRMELASQEPWVVIHLDDPREHAVWRPATDTQSTRLQSFMISRIDFKTVKMVSLIDFHVAVNRMCETSYFNLAGIGAKPHCAAFVDDISLLIHQLNHRMRGVVDKLP